MAVTAGLNLHPLDYCVAVVILLVPLLIGILFAYKDSKKNTRLEYLLGGRQMSVLPVALSTFVTFISAISIIGVTSEIYLYGTGTSIQSVGYSLVYVAACYTLVPLIYPLKITSIFEYLQLRFQSPFLRIFIALLGCLQTILYMAFVLLTPALALQAIGEIPLWMSILVVGGIGTIYTVIGGIKSVIWTDVFQTIIVFVGVFVIIIKGSYIVGGLDKVWSIANDAQRIQFSKFNPDPRIRLSLVSATLGGLFYWLTAMFNQSTIQRIRSLKTMEDAQRSCLLNVPLHLLCLGTLLLVGVVTYAYFDFVKCDPLQGGQIKNPNQVLPYFVYTAMTDLPGMFGMFMATLFCGSLSTFSSGVNALAAMTTEDILKRLLKNMDERSLTLVTKVTAALYGVSICCIAYLAQYMDGPVSQMTVIVIGGIGCPIGGVFLLACIVPWVDKYGAATGGLVSLAFNLWISIGSALHGKRYPRLQPADIDNCDSSNSTFIANYSFNNSSLSEKMSYISSSNNASSNPMLNSMSYEFSLYDVSYEWFAIFGTLLCIVVGLTVSYCTRDKSWRKRKAIYHLVFPFSRRLWYLVPPGYDDDVTFMESHKMKVSPEKTELL